MFSEKRPLSKPNISLCTRWASTSYKWDYNFAHRGENTQQVPIYFRPLIGVPPVDGSEILRSPVEVGS